MNEQLLKKLMNEESLDAAEYLALEQALEAGDETLIAHYFGAQDHIEPSLAWRSGLNDQLRQIAPKPQRRVNWLALGGLVSIGACACAFMFFVVSQNGNAGSSNLSARQIASNGNVTPDRVDGQPQSESELGHILVTSHQSDSAQASLGVRSPRNLSRTVSDIRLDHEDW